MYFESCAIVYAYLGPIQIHIFPIKKWVVVKIRFHEIAVRLWINSNSFIVTDFGFSYGRIFPCTKRKVRDLSRKTFIEKRIWTILTALSPHINWQRAGTQRHNGNHSPPDLWRGTLYSFWKPKQKLLPKTIHWVG